MLLEPEFEALFDTNTFTDLCLHVCSEKLRVRWGHNALFDQHQGDYISWHEALTRAMRERTGQPNAALWNAYFRWMDNRPDRYRFASTMGHAACTIYDHEWTLHISGSLVRIVCADPCDEPFTEWYDENGDESRSCVCMNQYLDDFGYTVADIPVDLALIDHNKHDGPKVSISSYVQDRRLPFKTS